MATTSARLPLADALARPLTDLRVSVTDRCNFRCRYCMPRELFGPDHAFLEREELLSFEEILRVTRVMADLGVSKVRLTGGEPLLRQDLDHLVAGLADIDAIDDLAMTTNGSLLPRHADDLAAAGLHRVTVSLDALDDEVHRAISDTRVPVSAVMAGVDAAREAGLGVKVNTVVKRGVNEAEIVPLATWARELGVTIRFIEYMDVGTTNGWRMDDVVPAREVLAMLEEVAPLAPVEADDRASRTDGAAGDDGADGSRVVSDVEPRQTASGQVAQRWRWEDGGGEVGVIASVTQPFCSTCSRVRLSSVGELFTCLFANSGRDLRAPLREGVDDDELAAIVTDVWTHRTDRYSEVRSEATRDGDRVEMSYIGG